MRNNQQEEEIKRTISYSLYREFICGHIVKILQEIYGLQYSELSKMHDEIEISLKNKTPSLYRDLFGYQTILAIVSISEVIDKIIEGDLNSSFCLVSLSFTHSHFSNTSFSKKKNDDISSADDKSSKICLKSLFCTSQAIIQKLILILSANYQRMCRLL